MASAIIHICVAKKVNEYLNFREKELFLGAIAPDISKQINQDKVKSHFLSEIDDVPNMELFMHKYKNKIKTPFDYGYLIHLYTDKIWYLNVEKYFLDKVDKNFTETPEYKDFSDSIRTLIYGDYTNMNIKLIDRYNLDLTLFYEDFEVPNTCIKEIPIKKLNVLIEQMGIIIANSYNGRNRVFDSSKVVNFINDCADKIIEFLKENNL